MKNKKINKCRNRCSAQEGYTLVELLISVSLASAVSVGSYMAIAKEMEQSKVQTASQTLTLIATAVKAFSHVATDYGPLAAAPQAFLPGEMFEVDGSLRPSPWGGSVRIQTNAGTRPNESYSVIFDSVKAYACSQLITKNFEHYARVSVNSGNVWTRGSPSANPADITNACASASNRVEFQSLSMMGTLPPAAFSSMPLPAPIAALTPIPAQIPASIPVPIASVPIPSQTPAPAPAPTPVSPPTPSPTPSTTPTPAPTATEIPSLDCTKIAWTKSSFSANTSADQRACYTMWEGAEPPPSTPAPVPAPPPAPTPAPTPISAPAPLPTEAAMFIPAAWGRGAYYYHMDGLKNGYLSNSLFYKNTEIWAIESSPDVGMLVIFKGLHPCNFFNTITIGGVTSPTITYATGYQECTQYGDKTVYTMKTLITLVPGQSYTVTIQ